VSGTPRGFGSPARTQILTLVAIGPGQICVSKKDDNFLNKDFPTGQVNDFADNLDFEKIKTWDRLKNNTAYPSHF
jgi:hypothetical protein